MFLEAKFQVWVPTVSVGDPFFLCWLSLRQVFESYSCFEKQNRCDIEMNVAKFEGVKKYIRICTLGSAYKPKEGCCGLYLFCHN